MTSGASETIFRNFLSRSSRATGPKTRVPTGSPTSLMSTAAFESKRMYVPSRRRYSLRVRTMTALTTLPFFTWPSGEASFTAAVTISPRPAFLPLEPPRGRIICSLRAPELSATSSMVLICTAIANSPYIFLQRLLGGRSCCFFSLRQCRTADNLFQVPALQLAQGTRLADPDHITHARRVLLVVRVKLLVGLHHALVLGMGLAHLDLNHDGFRHLGRNDVANLFIAARYLAALFRARLRGFARRLCSFSHGLARLLRRLCLGPGLHRS